MPKKTLEQSYIPFQCMIENTLFRFNAEGLSSAQRYILEILATSGEKNAKELAEIRGISQSGISKLTKRMLDKGLVIQTRSSLDRRSYRIVITDVGRSFLARSQELRNEMLAVIEGALKPDEVKTFAALCRKICKKSQEPRKP